MRGLEGTELRWQGGLWRLGTLIGHGRFASVHLCLGLGSGRLLAAKVLHRAPRESSNDTRGGCENDDGEGIASGGAGSSSNNSNSSSSSSAAAAAAAQVQRRELDLGSTLRHRNILRYFGTAMLRRRGSADTSTVLLTEFISGGSVAGLIQECGPLGDTAAAKFTAQLLAALVHMHERRTSTPAA